MRRLLPTTFKCRGDGLTVQGECDPPVWVSLGLPWWVT